MITASTQNEAWLWAVQKARILYVVQPLFPARNHFCYGGVSAWTWLEHWSVETDTSGSSLWLSTAPTQRFIKLLRTVVYFADLGMIKDVRPVGGGLIFSSEVKVMLASVAASGSMFGWGNVPLTSLAWAFLDFCLAPFLFLALGSSVQLFFTVGLKCPANLTCFIIKIQKRSKEEVQIKVTAQIQCAVERWHRY